MTTTTEKALPAREILLVGPYGVLGTGVLDAAAANAAWRITNPTVFIWALLTLAPTCPKRASKFPLVSISGKSKTNCYVS